MTDLISKQAQSGYSPRLSIAVTFGIASSGVVSDTIIMPLGTTLNALIFPTAFTGAAVGFNASDDGINFYPMCDPTTGSPITLTVPLSLTAGAWASLPPATLCSARFVQVTCDAQGAGRSLQAIARALS